MSCEYETGSLPFRILSHATIETAIAAISLIVVSLLIWSLASRAQRIAVLNASRESRELVDQLTQSKLALTVISGDDAAIQRSISAAFVWKIDV